MNKANSLPTLQTLGLSETPPQALLNLQGLCPAPLLEQGLPEPANAHVCDAQRASAADRARAGPALLRAQPFTPWENAEAPT